MCSSTSPSSYVLALRCYAVSRNLEQIEWLE